MVYLLLLADIPLFNYLKGRMKSLAAGNHKYTVVSEVASFVVNMYYLMYHKFYCLGRLICTT